jgi:hypothetical protein
LRRDGLIRPGWHNLARRYTIGASEAGEFLAYCVRAFVKSSTDITVKLST